LRVWRKRICREFGERKVGEKEFRESELGELEVGERGKVWTSMGE